MTLLHGIWVAVVSLVVVQNSLSQNVTHERRRSLNNFVSTSIPYIVEKQNIVDDDALTWHNDANSADTDKAFMANPLIIAQDRIDCTNEMQCSQNVSSDSSSAEATFRPYSQEELNKFLEKFDGSHKEVLEGQESTNRVATYYSVGNLNNIGTSSPLPTESQDKSKSWNLVNTQTYKSPYDDRMGWVTLEPVAWSSSQVQKWEPNHKQSWPIPAQSNTPSWNSPQYQSQPSYSERPWKKPSYQYPQKQWGNQNYPKPQYQEQYGGFGNQEIITDGQPGYFPSERPVGGYKPWAEHSHPHSSPIPEPVGRPSTQVIYQGNSERPDRPHSSEENGHWVLLSSTKGYTSPHRQRSLSLQNTTEQRRQRSLAFPSNGDSSRVQFLSPGPIQLRILENNDRPVTKGRVQKLLKPDKEEKIKTPNVSHRTVRLTVLPPLNTSGATTTSHGGMIEVDSNHQTVEDAHREHVARMMRFKGKEFNAPKSDSRIGMQTNAENIDRQSNLLAAVGAGMVPATMAMLLPMLLGRRKRDAAENDMFKFEKRFKSNVNARFNLEDQYPRRRLVLQAIDR